MSVVMEQPKDPSQDQPKEQPTEQPSDRMLERPDFGALRERFEPPSRLAVRWERFLNAVQNSTLWTVILAMAIIAVLVFAYLQLT